MAPCGASSERTQCSIGMRACAAADEPSLPVRQLLDDVCDIAVAVPLLARVLACSVLPRLALLARLAERSCAAQSSGEPMLGKVLGAFAEAMPEVRALEIVSSTHDTQDMSACAEHALQTSTVHTGGHQAVPTDSA